MEKSIPEDIARDILVWLPVKPLIRLKCVSKSWFFFISDPNFIKLHLQYSNHHQKFLRPDFHLDFDLISRQSTQIALPFKNLKQHYPKFCKLDIKCSCDGLLLLAYYYGKTGQILVWNPLTRESRELPKVDGHQFITGLTYYNFGYDSSTNDYNVIIDIYSHPDFGFSLLRDLMVFSLKKSSSWRRIKDFNYDMRLKKCINLSGTLHWLQRHDKDKIISFSLAEETIMEMELPNNSPGVGRKLSIWQGCLCLSETITSHPHHHSVSLNVWLMKEYGSWTKFITIPKLPFIDPLRRTISSAPYYSMKKAIFIIKQEWNSTFFIYDLEGKEFEIIGCETYQYFRKGLTFIESLVSPNFN